METSLSEHDKQAIKTSEKLEQWFENGIATVGGQPHKVLELAHKILAHAAESKMPQYMVLGTLLKAICFKHLGDGKALSTFKEAKRLHQHHTPKNKHYLRLILNNQARLYIIKGNYQLALDSFLACIPLCEAHTLAPIYNNIAIVYCNIRNFTKGIEFLKKAEAISDMEKGLTFALKIKNNLAGCYMETGKINQAMQMAFEVIDIIEARPEKEHQLKVPYTYTLSILGGIYLRKKNFEKALDILKQALHKSEEMSFAYLSCGIHENIAQIYFAKQDEEMAMKHASKALDTAEAHGFIKNKKTVLEKVIEFYKNNNQLAKAFPFKEKLYELSQEQLTESREKNLQKIITEREQEIHLLEEKNNEIEEQNAILKQFAYIISHDLREPIRGITGFAQMLNNKYAKNLDKTANEYIRFILSEAHSMNRNLARLLQYTTIEKNTDNVKEINLQQIITEIQQRYQDESFQLNITHESGTIKMQHQHAILLLSELIDNAIQFRKEGEDCQIEIKCELKEGYYQLSIKDYGIGIEAAYQGKIFKLFNKINKYEDSGAGVGLAICERIIQLYKGKISVESIPNHFSIFQISISTT